MPEVITDKELLASIIPANVDTDETHLYLLQEERVKIAEALLEKFVIMPKEDKLTKAYEQRMNKLFG